MARPWSLGHPHPGHDMRVMRHRLYHFGHSFLGPESRRHGTFVRCSCGDPFGWVRVSNSPPSRSQPQVNAHYHAHVEQASAWAGREAEPVFGEPPCL